MSELLQIQRAMQCHLLDPACADKTLALDAVVMETESVSRAVRLNIYANAYRARLVEALAVDFGMLHTYLGDAEFSDLVHAYIERHPSRYFSMRAIGSELSQFLQTAAPYAEHIELHELAEFEWALCHAFDAADAACAHSADLTALAPAQWAELKLQFVPSLRVLALRSNAPEIWKALNSEQSPPAPEISAAPIAWLVWRRDLTLLFRAIDDVEKAMLDNFSSGAAFADVCGALAEALAEEVVPQRAVAVLQQWLQDGVIAK